MKIIIFIYSILLLLISSTEISADSLMHEKVFHSKLKNGLEVYVIQSNRSPIVLHSLWYRVGAVNDPIGSSGMAHYLEHLMFHGTQKFLPFFEEIEKIGGFTNAYTTQFFTMYYSISPKENLEYIMSVEADRMSNLKISSIKALNERNVVLEERNQRVETNDSQLLYEEIVRIFCNQYCNRPIIGWKNEITNLDIKTTQKFYEKYYNPNNAILIVAGDVNPEDVIKLAKKIYVNKKGKRINNYSYPIDNSLKFPTNITYEGSNLVSEPHLYILYKFPKALDEVEKLAANILSDILGGRRQSLLRKALVQKTDMAVHVSSSYVSTLNALNIEIIPNHNTSISLIERSVQDIIDNFVNKGVSKEDLQEVKYAYKADRQMYDFNDLISLVDFYGNYLIEGNSLQEIQDIYGERLNNINENTINEVMKSLFSYKVKLTATLLPKREKINEINEEINETNK